MNPNGVTRENPAFPKDLQGFVIIRDLHWEPGESKPKKITAEITIEIIPDEDEIKEYVKAQKKTERRSVVFFLALIICVVSILYIDIHQVHGLYLFGFFF